MLAIVIIVIFIVTILGITFMQGIYMKQTMFLGCIVLQLFCIYNLFYM